MPVAEPTLEMLSIRRPLVADFEVLLRGPRSLVGALLPSLPVETVGAASRGRAPIPVYAAYGTPAAAVGDLEMEHHGIRVLRQGDSLLARGPAVSARLSGGEVELRCAPDAEIRELHAVFSIVWPFALPRFGVYHVHAAAVRDPAGRGWLLAGDANIGKSTSTLSLVTEGWQFAADDAVYLEPSAAGVIAHGWAEPIRLTARSAQALGVERQDEASRAKASAILREELGSRRVKGFPIHRLLFPRLAERTRLRPLRASDALGRLVRASAWVMAQPELAPQYVAALRALAMLPSAEVTLGPELLEEPALLAAHLAGAAAA